MINVSQFNRTCAFVIRLIEVSWQLKKPFFLLWMAIIVMFALSFSALDVTVYENEEWNFIGGNYDGFFGMAGALFLWTFRNCVVRLKPLSFKYMYFGTRMMAWFYWFLIVFISCIIFMSFIISVLKHAYRIVKKTKEEEVWQKRCRILVDLDFVFRKFGLRSPTSILITKKEIPKDTMMIAIILKRS